MEKQVQKRKSFSAKEKLYALDQLKKGKQQTQLARDLAISESALRGWKTDEGKLRSLPSILEEETGLQRKRVKLANDNVLDSALYQWFVQARSEGVPISGPILKAQAEKFDRIISVFKQNYRREMIKGMVADHNASVDTSLALLNLKEVCHLGGKAWDAITARCIERCWIKGLGPAFTPSTQNNSDDKLEFTGFTEDDVRLAEEALKKYEHSHHDILNWYSVDDICPIYEHISDDEIVTNVSRKNEAAQSEPETSDDNDNDDDGTPTPPPKVSEAVVHLEASLRWLETQDVDSVKVLQLRNILDFARTQQFVAKKQTSLDIFFKK